jgi:glycosyltransferase involved in cell wall biosynthesis
MNFFNALWRPVLELATLLGLRAKQGEANWLTPADVRNLLELAGWQLVKEQARILCPISLIGIDQFFNRWLAPIIPFLCLTNFQIARPRWSQRGSQFTVSVIVPARNEAGNIESAVLRIPEMGVDTEVIFIEGNSSDHTWDEIQRVINAHPQRKLRALRQTGKGKGNAVREAFSVATGDIIMILDADLTMPPEELPKFYSALASGYAEFANGVRLVYPMEKEAMRFLNLCGNKFFSIAFSWMLNQPIKDTLCGTKVMFRVDYALLAANRSYFGDFDPFGDFDLIFGADKLNLKLCDIPIRYRDRTYGSTNIDRWRHGALLLRMVLFAAWKLKFI